MKTYTHSPLTASRQPRRWNLLATGLEELLAVSRPVREQLEALFGLLRGYFPLDHLSVIDPSIPLISQGAVSTYYAHPALGGSSLLQTPVSTEQGNVILSTDKQKIVRVGDQDDHSIIINMVHERLNRTHFSIMFFRYIDESQSVRNISLISRQKNAYTETHAACLFLVMDVLARHWESFEFPPPPPPSPTGTELSPSWLPLDSLPGMESTLALLRKISRQDCPVLLLGETGTGKEVAANTIYEGSARWGAPFVKLNCGSIPETLIDSELFGHERGAYTGAAETVKGRFERADRGFLLLDELGELPPTAQTRLLRVLQEGVVERVGGATEIPVDVRVLAATHRDLPTLAREGRFRQDLLYRLNIFPVYIPALRERPEDIPPLLDFFIRRQCRRQGFSAPRLSAADTRRLCSYPWPGNIRELQNAVDRAVILWGGGAESEFRITPGEFAFRLPPALMAGLAREDMPTIGTLPAGLTDTRSAGPNPAQPDLSLDAAMRAHILRVLTMTGGQIAGQGGAAELLRIDPGTLRARMHKLGLLTERKRGG